MKEFTLTNPDRILPHFNGVVERAKSWVNKKLKTGYIGKVAKIGVQSGCRIWITGF